MIKKAMTKESFQWRWEDLFRWPLLILLMGWATGIAQGQDVDPSEIEQTCTTKTQGWGSGAGSLGRGSVDVRWISTTPASQILEFRVFAGWAINQTPAGYFNAGTALHYSLQYVCPINGGQVTIVEMRRNGTSCSASYPGPELPHGGCAGGNTSGLSTRHAASFSSFLAPDAIGAAFGDASFTTVTAISYDADPQTPGYQLPTELGGVRFLIDDQPVGLFFVSPEQVNFHVPAKLSPGLHQVRAVTPDGRTLFGDVYLNKNQPGIFTQESNGQGQATYYWWIFRNGLPYRILTPSQFKRSDVQPGDRVFVILFGSGIVSGDATLRLSNGRVFTSLYAGDTPYFVGLDQVNFEIPLSDLWDGILGASLTVFDGTGASWNSNGFKMLGFVDR